MVQALACKLKVAVGGLMPTSPTQELRRNTRYKIRDGSIRLHHPVMPALNCILIDISEGGARCKMDTSSLDEFASTAWRQLMSSGKLINVEVLAPGLTQRCMIHADVRHIRLSDENALDFGLKFHKPDAMQMDAIQRSIRGYSRARERQPFDAAVETVQEKAPTSSTVMMKRSDSTRRLDAPVVSTPQKPKTLADAARHFWKGLTGKTHKPGTNYRGMKIGEILMRMGRITPKQAVDAYEKARAGKVKFGRYLVRQRLITPVELSRALSLQTGLPIVDLANVTVPDTVKSTFPLEMLKEYNFVPFNQFGLEVYIAVAQPLSKEVLKTLETECRLRLKVFLAYDEVIEAMQASAFFTPEE